MKTVRITALSMLACVVTTAPATGQMTVSDLTNLPQNLMTALESVTQTYTQAEQFITQLEEYERVLQNAAAPVAYAWDKSNEIVEKTKHYADVKARINDKMKQLNASIEQLGDLDYYRGSNCYGPDINGCNKAQWKIMRENHRHGEEAMADAVNSLATSMRKEMDNESASFKNDAKQIRTLQRASEAAGRQGHMATMQAGNQLSSNIATQMLGLRQQMSRLNGLLAAQAKHQATKAAARKAASERFNRRRFKPSVRMTY